MNELIIDNNYLNSQIYTTYSTYTIPVCEETKTVNVLELIARVEMLTKLVKEMYKTINNLEEEINELKNKT